MTEQTKVKRSTPLPFVQVATAIIRDETLSGQARHLYTVLATYADISTREAKLYRSTLAQVIGKSVDTLDRLVKELGDAGIVSVLTQKDANGVFQSSVYSLHDSNLIASRAVQDTEIEVAAPMRLPIPESTDSEDLGSRTDAATSPHPCGQGGRTHAAGVAAPMRHITRDLEQETLNERKPLVAADAATAAPKPAKRHRRTETELNADRPELGRLCDHLADRVEAHGFTRPVVSEDWLTTARRMIDINGYTEDQIHRAIDWCQDSDFWYPNIRSMAKLRDQYETLRDRAAAELRKKQSPARLTTADRVAAVQALKRGRAEPSTPQFAIGG